MPNSLRCKIKHLCHNGTLTERERDRILKALELIPDSATNGDVIKALFPCIEVRLVNDDTLVQYTLDGFVGNTVTRDWWNAPYRKE